MSQWVNKLLTLLLLGWTLGVPVAGAQTKNNKNGPPPDAGAQIAARLMQVQDKSYKELASEFTLVWNSSFSTVQKAGIEQALQLMDGRNLPDHPFLGNYARILIRYGQPGSPLLTIEDWHTFYIEYLSKRPQSNHIEEFLRFSEGLIQDGWIHRGEAFGWRLEEPQGFTLSLSAAKLPQFNCTSARLWCVAQEDSFALQVGETGGQVMEKKLRVGSGRADWSRLGLPADSIYAVLGRLEINLKTPTARCENAVLHTSSLKQKLTGLWQDRIRTGLMTEEEPAFPRFESSTPVGTIPARLPKSMTLGIYSLIGRRYALRRFNDRPAMLGWRPDDRTEITVEASTLYFSPTRIVSPFASVVIRTGADSIHQPGIAFEYDTESHEMWLRMPLRTPNLSPFILSAPRMQAYCEQMYWKKGSDTLHFRVYLGRNDSTALFVSTAYFDPNEFQSITSASGSNELWAFIQYIQKTGRTVVDAADYAATMRMTPTAVQSLFIQLAQAGFAGYDLEENKVQVLPKLERYFSRSDENTDFDHIRIISNPASGTFARYHLREGTLHLEGVRAVALNDSHSVILHPKNGKIQVGRDLRMTWAGRLTAGPLAFAGPSFAFDYERYQVTIDSARSLTLYSLSDERDQRGRWIRIPLRTVIQDISGVLQIDSPEMKSARRPNFSYPYFISTRPSYVYFDQPEIQGGAYTRDAFYYRIDTFSLGRLDFDDALDSLKLQGELVSPTFPPIREPLRRMHDGSLGFTSPFIAGGRPVHGNRARADVALTLDGEGLTGAGSFYFLNSEIRCDSIVFLPGLTRGPVRRMKVRNDADYSRPAPEFETGDGRFEWRPANDSLSVFALQNPFAVFDEETEFAGSFSMTPGSLHARGVLSRGAQRVASEQFEWQRKGWSARYCRVEMDLGGEGAAADLSTGPGAVRLLTADSLRGQMDYRNGEARFEAEADRSPVQLPYNDYRLRLPHLGWNLDSAAVTLGWSDKNAVERVLFVATDPESDSIQLEATHARLQLETGALSLFGIEYIPCADAWIYPAEGTVQLGRKSKIQPMVGARIVWDTLTRAHEAIDVGVSISSRLQYKGSGYYHYQVPGEAAQRIRLKEISVDSGGVTRATARVYRDSGFVVAPGIRFGGTLDIQGDSVGILFSGVGGLKYLSNVSWSGFFKIDTRYNPKTEPGLRLSGWLDGSGKPLYAGLFLNSSKAIVYPLLIGKKRNPADSALAFIETGTVLYDTATAHYRIVAPDNATNGSHAVHSLLFSPDDSTVTAEGRLWCLSRTASGSWLSIAGKMSHSLNEQETRVDALMYVRNVLPQNGFGYFGGLLAANYFRMSGSVEAMDWFEPALTCLSPPEQVGELLLNYRLSRQFPQDPVAANTWCFALQSMRWDADERSFAASKQMGLIRAGGELINRHYPTFVEFRRLPKTETFHLLVMPERDKEWLLQHRNGSFYTYSTDPDYQKLFNEERALVKKKQRDLYRESDESTYFQVLSRKEALDAMSGEE
jgi:hypothetical protein